MWLRLKNGRYLQPETGANFHVAHGNYDEWVVNVTCLGRVAVVDTGYASEKDAQAALDELMVDQDAVRIQPPTTAEESTVDV